MINILRRLWPRLGATLTFVDQPISLTRATPDDRAWFGFHDQGGWIWDFRDRPGYDHTHWLPATVEALPARCCPPEVG